MRRLPGEIDEVELAVTDHLLALHVALLDHDLHREDAVTAGRVLVAEGGGGLALLDAALQNGEDVGHVKYSDLFQVLAHHASLHVLAELQLLVARDVEQILQLLVIYTQKECKWFSEVPNEK